MFSFDKAALEKASAETGFVRDNLEKVYRLMDVLEFINNNPFLKDKLVLKGGTAINLTVFDLPRLSVDIDLDYCNNCSKDEMLADRTGEFIERIDFGVIDKLTQSKVRQTLLPVLKRGTFVDISVMKSEVKQFLESLMKLTDQEQMYIDDFNKGKYSPELLFNDVRVIERINNHPMALWKCGRAL